MKFFFLNKKNRDWKAYERYARSLRGAHRSKEMSWTQVTCRPIRSYTWFEMGAEYLVLKIPRGEDDDKAA